MSPPGRTAAGAGGGRRPAAGRGRAPAPRPLPRPRPGTPATSPPRGTKTTSPAGGGCGPGWPPPPAAAWPRAGAAWGRSRGHPAVSGVSNVYFNICLIFGHLVLSFNCVPLAFCQFRPASLNSGAPLPTITAQRSAQFLCGAAGERFN